MKCRIKITQREYYDAGSGEYWSYMPSPTSPPTILTFDGCYDSATQTIEIFCSDANEAQGFQTNYQQGQFHGTVQSRVVTGQHLPHCHPSLLKQLREREMGKRSVLEANIPMTVTGTYQGTSSNVVTYLLTGKPSWPNHLP